MGRKKKNARSAAHGRKIHVNKYINQRGKTKKRAVASCQPAPNSAASGDAAYQMAGTKDTEAV